MGPGSLVFNLSRNPGMELGVIGGLSNPTNFFLAPPFLLPGSKPMYEPDMIVSNPDIPEDAMRGRATQKRDSSRTR